MGKKKEAEVVEEVKKEDETATLKEKAKQELEEDEEEDEGFLNFAEWVEEQQEDLKERFEEEKKEGQTFEQFALETFKRDMENDPNMADFYEEYKKGKETYDQFIDRRVKQEQEQATKERKVAQEKEQEFKRSLGSFELKTSTYGLSDIFPATRVFSDISLDLKKDGIHIAEIDDSHTAMVIINLPKSNFEEYKLSKETRITVSRAKLKQVIGAFSYDKLTIRNEDTQLVISNGKEEYKISLLGGGRADNAFKIPEIAYTYEVRIKSQAQLMDLIRHAGYMDDSIAFSTDGSSLKISSEGNGSYEGILEVGLINKIGEGDKVKATFDIETLKKLLCDVEKIYLRKDSPMKLEGRKVVCYLAQQVGK